MSFISITFESSVIIGIRGEPSWRGSIAVLFTLIASLSVGFTFLAIAARELVPRIRHTRHLILIDKLPMYNAQKD